MLRPDERAEHRLELGLRFGEFGERVRIGNAAAARDQAVAASAMPGLRDREAAAGAALALPGPTATLLGWTLGTPGAAPVLASQSGPQVLPSTALAAARQALPGARLAWIETPPLSGGNYRFRLQLPGDPSMRFPHSYVTVQGQSAKVLAIFDARAQGPATTFNNWLHPLHDGSAGGFWLRSLWLLAGAAPLMLFTLGIRRWRLRRRRYGEAV